ncbi:MAG: response regulator [Lentisphaeria bacterium]|nr:response regulator [Lentisphaeria bacterium]NQZ66782.1 response regulator [Lentisphaeria bacterium]
MKKYILFVDDEASILSSLRRCFRKENYRQEYIQTTKKAYELIKEDPPDMIISDHLMPGINGVEFLTGLKADYPNIIFIIISGYTNFKTVIEALNSGVISHFIAKPWDDQKLRLTISDCFSYHENEQKQQNTLLHSASENEFLKNCNDSLYDIIADRTEALSLAQEIIIRLPIRIIGVSPAGQVLYISNLLFQDLPGMFDAWIGKDFEIVMPAALAKAINTVLETETTETLSNCLGKVDYELTIYPLQIKQGNCVFISMERCG